MWIGQGVISGGRQCPPYFHFVMSVLSPSQDDAYFLHCTVPIIPFKTTNIWEDNVKQCKYLISHQNFLLDLASIDESLQ